MTQPQLTHLFCLPAQPSKRKAAYLPNLFFQYQLQAQSQYINSNKFNKIMQKEKRGHICKTIKQTQNLQKIVSHFPTETKLEHIKMQPEKHQCLSQASLLHVGEEEQSRETSFEKDLLKGHVQVAKDHLPLLLTLNIDENQSLPLPTTVELQLVDSDKMTPRFIQEEILKLNLYKGKWMEKEVAKTVVTFLGRVIGTVSPPIARQAIALTHRIYCSRSPREDNANSLPVLLNEAVRIAKIIIKEWKATFQSKEEKIEAEKSMKAYCVTVLLVINEYFENPYFNDPTYCVPRDQSDCDSSPLQPKKPGIAKPHKLHHKDSPAEELL